MEQGGDWLNGFQIDSLMDKTLFHGMRRGEICAFLEYAKPTCVKLYEGQTLTAGKNYYNVLGLLVAGVVHVNSVDYDGTKTMLRAISAQGTSDMFYSSSDYQNRLIELSAFTDAEIMMFPPESVLEADESVLLVQHKVLVNMIQTQRELFHDIKKKVEVLSQRTVRDKILRILHWCSEEERCYEFTVPFTREGLAYFLAVDRASLSRSLSALKREGVIDFHRNKFRIITTEQFRY